MTSIWSRAPAVGFVTAALCACEPEGYVGSWMDSPPTAATVDAAALGDSSVNTAGMTSSSPNAATTTTLDAEAAGASRMGALADHCQIARAGPTQLEVTVVDPNAVMYAFADGASFPAGRYRIEYVDGCRRYDNTAAWTVHASLLAAELALEGRGGCYFVMSNSRAIDLAPGTVGLVVGEGPEPVGAFASYDECVTANRMIAARDVTLAAGPIGIMNSGDSTRDKTSGEAVGRRSPTYRLTRLDPCP